MINEKTNLTEKQLLILQSEMEMRRRSTLVAYLIFLFFPLALIGGHHWYLRNFGRALAYPFSALLLIACAIGESSLVEQGIGMWAMGAYFLLIALDFCSLAFQVGRTNRRIERKIIKSLIANEEIDPNQPIKAA